MSGSSTSVSLPLMPIGDNKVYNNEQDNDSSRNLDLSEKKNYDYEYTDARDFSDSRDESQTTTNVAFLSVHGPTAGWALLLLVLALVLIVVVWLWLRHRYKQKRAKRDELTTLRIMNQRGERTRNIETTVDVGTGGPKGSKEEGGTGPVETGTTKHSEEGTSTVAVGTATTASDRIERLRV